MIPVLPDNVLERQGGIYRQQQPVERRGRRLGCEVAGFTARRHHACVIPRITYRRDQASLVNAIQQVLDHRFVLRKINIDMHDARQPIQRRGHMAHARTAGHADDAEPGRMDQGRVRSV